MKKLLVVAVVGFLAWTSQAAYLYWQVDSEDLHGIQADYASVWAVTGYKSGNKDDPGNWTKSEELLLADQKTGLDISDSTLADVGGGTAVIRMDQVGDPSAYSYFIELYKYNESAQEWEVVGHSQVTSYSDLKQSQFVDTGFDLNIPPVAVWHGGAYAVPEPTSSLLMILGFGLLTLKRKRV